MKADGLQVSDLQVNYGRRAIVHGVSLPTLMPGSLTALIGPNGAGKSTLLRGVAGLERMSGSVTLNGEELTRLSIVNRARQICYMPQNLPAALALSVIESVIAGVRIDGKGRAFERAYEALAQIGIGHLADHWLNGLSGGQRQLVSLAQLIARRPAVMLLDEPTSALDLNYQLRVMECVKTLVREHHLTAVIVMHDINLAARYADHIAVLRHGALVDFGAPADVLSPQLFADVYGVRARIERCSRQNLQVLVDTPT